MFEAVYTITGYQVFGIAAMSTMIGLVFGYILSRLS